MKTPTLKLCLVLIFSFVLFSCSNDDDGIYFEDIAEVAVEYSTIENEILDLVNKHRVSKGLSALIPLNIVSSVADSHTTYMIDAGEISHDNFPQRSQNLMTKANAKSAGENVAYGYGSAQGVVNGWLNSDGHRKVIENANYSHFGISTDCNMEGRNFFTHIFIDK